MDDALKALLAQLGTGLGERLQALVPALAGLDATLIGWAMIVLGAALSAFLLVFLAYALGGERRAARKAGAAFWRAIRTGIANPGKAVQTLGKEVVDALRDLSQDAGKDGALVKMHAQIAETLGVDVRRIRRGTPLRKRPALDAAIDAAAQAGLSIDEMVEALRAAPKQSAGDALTAAYLAKAERAIGDTDLFTRLRPVLSLVYERLCDDPAASPVIGRVQYAATHKRVEVVETVVAATTATVATVQTSVADIRERLPSLRLVRGFTPVLPEYVDRLPTGLIVADYGVIPYDDGRGLLGGIGDGERRTLLGWATSETPISVRLYAAGGGYGKTRLALQAIDALNAQGGTWIAGLLTRVALTEALAKPDSGAPSAFEAFLRTRGSTGVFVAIDYAEARQEQMKALAQALATAGDGGPIRIALLARSDAWWEGFLEGLGQGLERFFEPRAVSAVETEIAADRRTAFFEAACGAFAQRLGEADAIAKDRAPFVAPDWRTRKPDADAINAQGSPLHLALLAFLHVRGEALTKSPLKEMAREERLHHGRALKLDPTHAKVEASMRGAALVTLCQGLSPARCKANGLAALAQMAVRSLPALDAEPDAMVKARIALDIETALKRLYETGDGEALGVRPILPDLLGERVVGEALARAPDLLPALLDADATADHADAVEAFTVLNRASRDDAHGRPVHDVDEIVAQVQAALEAALATRLAGLADPLVRAMNNDAGRLNEPTLNVLQALPDMQRATAAQALIKAGGLVLAVNRPHDSTRFNSTVRRLVSGVPSRLANILGAAARCATLTSEWGDDGDIDYDRVHERAIELSHRAHFLAINNQVEEALALMRQAVDAYAELVVEYRDSFLLAQADAMSDLAELLARVGQFDESHFNASAAAGRLNQAVERGNKTAAPSLAKALLRLSAICALDKRHETALEMVQKAVGIYRSATASDRDNFLAPLASAVDVLGVRLGALGRREECLSNALEAVKLARDSAANNPHAHSSLLIEPLLHLSSALSSCDRLEEAKSATSEAVALSRTLVAENRAAFSSLLANSLAKDGLALSALGGSDEARRVSAEAVAIARRLHSESQTASVLLLAEMLDTQGDIFAQNQLRPEAIGSYAESAKLFDAAASRGAAFAERRAEVSNKLANMAR